MTEQNGQTTPNITRGAQSHLEGLGFDENQVRHELGLEEDVRVGMDLARFAAGMLSGDGSQASFSNTMMVGGYDEGLEPDWDELDIPVQLEEIQTVGGKAIPTRKAIIREDNGDCLNIVSNRYKLVQHREPVEIMQDAIAQMGLPVRGTRTTIGMNGGYMKVEWLIDDSAIPIRPKAGDILGLQAQVRSSFDYSSPFEAGLGLMRLICANGMVLPVAGAGIRRRHVGKFSVAEAIAGVQESVKELPRVQELFTSLVGRNANRDRFERWLKKQHMLGVHAVADILAQYDRGDGTMWDAYNAVTWYASHRVRGKTRDGAHIVRRDHVRASANRLMTAGIAEAA